MYRTTSKRLAAAVTALVLLTSALPAFAAEVEARGSAEVKVRAEGDAGICQRVTQYSGTLRAHLTDLRVKLDARRDERLAKIKGLRTQHQEAMTERRADWDTRWTELLLKLKARVMTDADKAAVATFKLEMDAAFKARKASVDAANTTFRAGIDKAITARKAAVQAAADKLKAGVLTALDKAKADCAASVAGATVQTNLKASLEAAQAQFRIDIQAAEKIGADARALAEARNEAIRKANVAFTAAAEASRAKLKAALKADASARAELKEANE